MSKKEKIQQVLFARIYDVLPDLESHPIVLTDSLQDLGANSIDRAEILMTTLEQLSLNVPLNQLVQAHTLESLIAFLDAHDDNRTGH